MNRNLENKAIQPFDTFEIKDSVFLRNRLVMAPMTTWSGETTGQLSDEEIEYYRARSSGVGMVITATTYVTPHGKGFYGQFFGGSDNMESSLKRLAEVIHSGGAKAILQVFHAGRKAVPSLMPDGITWSASSIPAKRELDQIPKAMTEAEIQAEIHAFYDVTRRAYRCGYDGIEIHGANTYLIQQFFSPHSNQRTDQWGGDIKRRVAFPLAIVKACEDARNTFPEADAKKFIIGYRFSPEENSEPGITLSDTDYLIDQLVNTGLDYLHVSLSSFSAPSIRGTQEPVLERIFQRVRGKKTFIGVGGICTVKDATQALQMMDLAAIGRQLLVDPQTVEKWEQGQSAWTHYDSQNHKALHIPMPLHKIIIERKDWVPLK